MKNMNLLYGNGEKHMSSSATDDMLFECLQESVFVTTPELYHCFINVISSPVVIKSDIEKRQEIIGDFIKNRGLPEKMLEICKQVKSIQVERSKNIYEKTNSRKRIQINLEVISKIFEAIEDLGNLLRKCEFNAPVLNEMKTYFTRTKDFEAFYQGLFEIASIYAPHYIIKGTIAFNDIAKFKTMTLNDFEIRTTQKKTWSIFNAEKDNIDVVRYENNSGIERHLDEIMEKAAYDFCGVLSAIYSFYKELFGSLYEQIMFYRSTIVFIEYLRDNKYNFTFPQFTDKEHSINTKGLYLLPLAIKNKTGITDSNDFECEKSSSFIITGYNRGGKTTFLRSIGFAQILAQSGLPVPATDYECSVFDFILSHFPKNEDKFMTHGMFEEEVAALREDINYIKFNALVMMNESFSTTVEKEGEVIARNVIKALSETGSLTLFVTHFYDLAVNMGKSGDAENLITEKYEKPNSRKNFRIVKGTPIQNYKIDLNDFI
ncbi:MAG: hypothetical protein DBX47_04575 [Clostridiales bacterium]|nr:MAG: hypothetical protein DBX47_04575 [Clostridiales bacterium]